MHPCAGRSEGRYLLLWIATDNNMVSDRGDTSQRHAPAPTAFGLVDVSREAVMDAYSWTYRVMSLEVAREKHVVQNSRPGAGTIRSPQQFAYLEACGEQQGTALSFSIGLGPRDGGTKWYESDGGKAAYRVDRSGCFRAAVPMPPGVTAERVKALRVRAYIRPPKEGEKPIAGPARARLTRVNRLFL